MSSDTETDALPTPEKIDRVVIRFAGDSGDGMQLAGSQFTASSAMFGNDLATLPNFPAEIRAPAGTLPFPPTFTRMTVDETRVKPVRCLVSQSRRGSSAWK